MGEKVMHSSYLVVFCAAFPVVDQLDLQNLWYGQFHFWLLATLILFQNYAV